MKRPAERPSGCRVTPGCAAEAQVDAARKERFERAELFCNDQWRMIGQHDAARAHTDFRGCICDVADQHGSRRACHAANIMVFSQPKSLVAQGFRMLRQGARVVERFLSRSSLP